MDDQKNNNLQNSERDPLFFNVMPKGKLNIDAPITSRPLATAAPLTVAGGPSLISKFPLKKITILVLILLVLGGGGFFVYSTFIKKDSVDNTTQEENKTAEQVEGVTTPKDWQVQYFGQENCILVSNCGDEADPDLDGLTNIEEYDNQTDPQNEDSDGDGLADGDEVNVFKSNPKQQYTAGNTQYSDADFARGGYNLITDELFSEAELNEIIERIKTFGLHQPTVQTIGEKALERYKFGEQLEQEVSTALPAGTDASPQAMLDRDTQRLNTIKKIGSALLKYKSAKKAFPQTDKFSDMVSSIRPYNIVATNYSDPINVAPFVYSYAVKAAGQDFQLTYYSETQKSVVKYDSSNALKDTTGESVTLNNDKRLEDLADIRTALLIYSAALVTEEQVYIFPAKDKYKTELVPNYISAIPKDPLTNKDYEYTVSASKDTFTLKANLESPKTGASIIICTEEQDCTIN